MRVDYIIVGQGITGTLLAHFLRKAGAEVLVVDDGHRFSASAVAAGMMNPVTGRRWVKSWQIGTILPFARSVYRALEQELSKNFFYPVPIYRPFASEQQKHIVKKKQQQEAYSAYLEKLDRSAWTASIHQPWGGVAIKGGGWLDMEHLIQTYREALREAGALREEKLVYADVEKKREGVSWQSVQAKGLIFCEGYRATENPYFEWLPFNLAKGELLEVENATWPETEILNKGIYILPAGEQRFYVGATYEWNDLSPHPTRKARQELDERLQKVVQTGYKVVDHYAGVRPTVKDRRPLIGRHPEHPRLCILNGMGTKGATLAPYFARQLAQHLLSGAPLTSEANIERFVGSD